MQAVHLVVRLGLWHFLKMVRIRTLLSSVMALALLSSSAHAEGEKILPSVKVRASDKGDYSRIVFDWGTLPKYTTQQTANGLVIKFESAANFLATGTSPSALPRVTGYKVLSPDSVKIDFESGEQVRHFVADNRLIVDIKDTGSVSSAKQAATPPKDLEKSHEKKPAISPRPVKDAGPVNLVKSIETASGEVTPDTPVIKKDVIKKEAPQTITKEKEPAHQDNGSAAALIEKVTSAAHQIQATAETPPESSTESPVPLEAHSKTLQINLTSTESISMAVFERSGYLWIVEDKDNVKVPPQIENNNKEKPLGFERVPSAAGLTVFRMKLENQGVPVASGGGLVWKINFQPRLPDTSKPVDMKRLFGDAAKDGGPSILWPAKELKRIAEIKDSEVGDTIYVALVDTSKDFAGDAQHFVDFDTLPSAIGLALVPKADELKIIKTPEGVLIDKPEGLTISSEKDVMTSSKSTLPEPAKIEGDKEMTRIYDFANWQVGTAQDLSDNQRLIMSGMVDQTDAKKTENLIGLGRLVLSFNYAPEALGYLDLALNKVPDLDGNPEFLSLRGAAEALSWKYKEAFADFSAAGLNDIGEMAYWKAYTLAKLDDWQQAAKILPNDVSILMTYPDAIKAPLSLTLAEVALREGNKDKAKRILDILEQGHTTMALPYASAYDYLKGEYARQNGKPDEAKEIWKSLTTGADDLYRAKARFALTMLQLGAKEITPDKAIDILEGLRYAWRGDDLEVSINYNLAKTYMDKGEPIKALTMMKLAHSLNPLSEQGKKIDADMHDVFKNLFTPEKVKTLSPVDALTVYNEFSDLVPAGAEGEALTRQLAERLADADLLPRATSLLKKQVDGNLQGLEGAGVAIRLAAIQNMDGKPDDALQSLDKAELFLKGLTAEDVLPKQEDIGMLRAKAFSMKGKPDDAFASLALLPQTDDALRLRADIAWRGKKWQDAADSLEQLVQNQEISLTRPLSDEQADLILNWAVALYLADNRYVLANLRERYADAMAATNKAQKFDVVTRPRQGALLSDRETINSIVDETVIFKDFLKSFKAGDVPVMPRPAVTEPVPDTAETQSATPPQNLPESLRNAQGLKTDEVLGD